MSVIPESVATSQSMSMSASGNCSAGSRRVHRITESASGSPDATPSENGSDVIGDGAMAVVVVAGDVVGETAVVVGVVVVVDGGSVVSGAPEVVDGEVCPSPSPSLQAASAAATVPARNPRPREPCWPVVVHRRPPIVVSPRIARQILVGRRVSGVTVTDRNSISHGRARLGPPVPSFGRDTRLSS